MADNRFSSSSDTARARAGLSIRKRKRYGWRRGLPDHRDYLYQVKAPKRLSSLPTTHQLAFSPWMPPVFDQGNLGSCTGNAIAAAFEFDLRRQKLADYTPSRLAIYYGERVIEQTVDSDSGAEIRDGMKVIAAQGAGPELLWPYNISRFTQAPPAAYFAAAAKRKAVSYESVPQTEVDIKRAIYAGYLVVMGFTVYDSFESDAVAATGHVPMPGPNESVLGGHAVAICGYGATRVSCRNSWGTGWGKNGNFDIPLDYVLNPDLASDFWLVKALSTTAR